MATDDLIVEKDDSNDRKIRLLICRTCNTIDPLPDWDGPVDYDDTLMSRVGMHQFDGTTRGHDLDLGRVSEQSWNEPTRRADILKEIAKNVGGPGGSDGLGQAFYDVKNTFQEDAMRCWRVEHSRTTNCGDYMSPKKLLLSDTRAERKAEGLDPKARGRTYLCKFCPYESVVQNRKNDKRGV